MISNYFFIIFFVTFNQQINSIYSVKSEELKNTPPDHIIPYSEHENPPEPSTKPKYGVPGDWARPPVEKNISLEFIPTTLYAQVRGSHIVKRVPRQQALRDASTDEERENASRLKEVVTNKKINTIYTEEGYEDAAYDHAGHIRDADFHEGYARKAKDEDEVRDLLELNSSESLEDDDYADHLSEEEGTSVEETLLKPTLDKTKKFHTESKKVLEDLDINPKRIVEVEGEQLERSLEEEAGEREKSVEIDVPENLKNLASDEDSLNPSEIIKYKFMDDSSEGGVYLQTTKVPSTTPPLSTHTSPRYSDNSSPIYPRYEDTTPKIYPKYRDIMATTTPNPTTVDYGKIFWDYFKTKKPDNLLTTKEPKQIVHQDNGLFNRRSENIAVSSKDRLTAYRPLESGNIAGRQYDLSSEYSSEELSDETTNPTDYYKLTPTPENIQEMSGSRYTTVTSPGMIQSILENPEIAEEIASKIYPKFEEVQQENGVTEEPVTMKKPSYTVVIRAPTTKPCDKINQHSNQFTQDYLNKLLKSKYEPNFEQSVNQMFPPKYDKLPYHNLIPKYEETVNKNYELLNRLTNNVNPKSVNNEVYSNSSLLKPPSLPPFGQVTYADYLRDIYGNYQPGPATAAAVHESESLEESEQSSMEKPHPPPQHYYKRPPPPPPQRPHIRQRYRPLPFLSWLTSLAPMARFILPKKILPPPPMSRSRYAEYPIKRIDEVKKNKPNILPFYNQVFQVNGAPVKRYKRQSTDFNEKVFSVLPIAKQHVTMKSSGLIKNSTINNDLLNDAPRIVQKVIDREIELHFPITESKLSTTQELENNDKGKVEIDVPEFDFSGNLKNIEAHKIPLVLEKKQFIDIYKYPFYNNNKVSSNSALRYAINPHEVPKKTLGGMEFYDSRDHYLNCEDINPDLSGVTPETEELEKKETNPSQQQRLYNLADKLSCFKAKYFDKNPLDNPLFIERRIDKPQLPVELNPRRFKDRIAGLVSDREEAMVYRRLTRRPEIIDMYSSEARHNTATKKSKITNHKFTRNHRRRKVRKENSNPIVNLIDTPYQKEVYEDVMGTIKIEASTMRPRKKQPEFLNKLPKPLKRPRFHSKSPPPIRKYKIIPSKVNYRNKPRSIPIQIAEPRFNPHRHKNRLHKRSIGSDLISPVAELDTNQGNWISNGININGSPQLPRRSFIINPLPQRSFVINQKIQRSTMAPIDSTVPSTERMVYTIRDRIKFSKPRDYIARSAGKFPITNTTTVDPRRGEPRYFNGSESPDETKLHSTTYPEVTSPEFNNAETTTYEVKEDIVETITPAPEVIKLKKYLEIRLPDDENKKNKSDSTEPTTPPYSDKNTSEEEKEEEEDKQEEESQGQQVERPTKSVEEASSEKNEGDSTSSAESYSNEEEENKDKSSDSEKEFERFSFRPTSPPEDYYDSKYAELGPRINKPAFYHPPFEVPRYERNRGKNYEASHEDKQSHKKSRKFKYIFPWELSEEENEKTSEESQRSEYWHEYPWEKRKRLARERRLKQKEDQHSSETGFHYEITRPTSYSSYPSSEIFDTVVAKSEYRPRREFKPRRFSSKYYKKSDNPGGEIEKIAKSIMYYMKNNMETSTKSLPMTTQTPQIPPTSATKAPKRESTTPIIETTSIIEIPKYTIRPRSYNKSSTKKYSIPIEDNSTILQRTSTPKNSILKRRIYSTTPRIFIPSSPISPTRRRRLRTRMTLTSTTTTNTPEIITKETITVPAKRTVEHRSRVSTEERITKASFPKLDNSRETTNNNEGMQKSERVRKVSIVTKETPDHIYRTEEIDRDGVKGMFISITPNNSTNKSIDFEDDMSMSTSDMVMDSGEDTNIPEEHRLASILAHLPPPPPDSMEGSGELEENEEVMNEPKVTYIKEPDQRLYYYVEDIN